MTDLLTLPSTETTKESEPAKPTRWRNRFLYKGAWGIAICHICYATQMMANGDEHTEHCETHPTKGEAEAAAQRDLANAAARGYRSLVYLGPIPDPC